jgi:hypothetical protein
MTNSSFLKKLIFALTALSVVFFVSCDDDFNILGSDVIDGDVHSDLTKEIVDVFAYDKPTGAVQANNMLQNQLGIYDNPVFGTTISHFVTQLELGTGATNPTLFEPVIDSVYLYVPYYSAADSIDASDNKTTIYKLDPAYIVGNQNAKFKLSVFRNGYFLRDSDPGASDNIQRYYSDDKAMVENMVVGAPLAEDGEFFFDPKEIQREADVDGTGPKEVKVIERLAPGIFMNLDKATMQEAIMSQAAKPNLLNNSIFENYFRGLYFKVEGTAGAMCIPNFAKGVVTIKFTDNEINTDGTKGTDRIIKTMTLNLKGNTVNFFENSYNSTFTNAVAASDVTNGDEKLFVKGGAGSMAIINIDDVKLAELRAALGPDAGNNSLINEANIVFYADRNTLDGMGKAGTVAPLRMYLYDLENRKPIIDYSMDGTTNLANAKGNKRIYGGIIDTLRNASGEITDVRYKFTVTNHIKNIIKGDSTNVRLGLVVTDNINITTNYKLKTPFTAEGSGLGTTDVKDVPYGSVQERFGTVLYGSKPASGSEDKRVKLEIYYSKPKE